MAFDKTLLYPRYWLTWLGVGLFSILAFVPWKLRYHLGRLIGYVIYKRNPKRQHIVQTNLTLCFPEQTPVQRERMVLAHLQDYAHALLSYSLLFFRSRKWLYEQIDIQGREHIETLLAQHKNIMLLLGHSVWLEFAPVALGAYYPLYGSYQPFKNPIINWLVARSRLTDAEFIVAREEGMLKLVRGFKHGRLLVFLPDEDHGLKVSVFAPFFNVPKATLTTPARLAKLGEAAALPIMAFFNTQTGRFEVMISPALHPYPLKDEQQNATLLNQGMEALIKLYPHQYMWLLKLFRTQPDSTVNVYKH
jgi:lauroyl/myristoyl acyltransferase